MIAVSTLFVEITCCFEKAMEKPSKLFMAKDGFNIKFPCKW